MLVGKLTKREPGCVLLNESWWVVPVAGKRKHSSGEATTHTVTTTLGGSESFTTESEEGDEGNDSEMVEDEGDESEDAPLSSSRESCLRRVRELRVSQANPERKPDHGDSPVL
jgi:hypothetical protein